MDKIDEVLTRGVEKVYPGRSALEKVLRSGKKIRLYQGFDPSMANLHLGNMVGLLKLKQFQDLGHEVVFLVGDFTGMIGDPTDKTAARKLLTRKQVLKNAKNWQEQAGRFLNFKGKNPAKMLFNSQWLDKVTFKDLINITANFTVQQMLERDFFQRRIKEEKSIFLHEFLYPVAQGYDNVAMDIDLEIGGSDQTFNMLAGRKLMKAIKGKEKFVLTTKLLVDSKGEKVGKTTGNALFLNASPTNLFGGVMSFPDEVLVLAFELLTTVSVSLIEQHKEALRKGKINPMDLKKKLALEIVRLNFGRAAAEKAQQEFERVFQKRKMPTKIKKLKIRPGKWSIVDLLMEAKLCQSRSEAKRLIKQGAVRIDESRITNHESRIKIKNAMVIKVGKRRFARLWTKS